MNLRISQKWQLSPLDQLLEFVTGGDWGKDENYLDSNFGFAYCIRGSEIKNWDLNKGKTASIRKVKKSSIECRKLKEGDILVEISGGGPEQPVGRTVLIDKSVLSFKPEIPKICTNFLRLIRPKSVIDSKYLNYYLKLFYISGDIVKYQGGSNNLRNLKFPDFIKISVPFPSLSEQLEITSKIEELFSDIENGKQQLLLAQQQLKIYRQSLLKAAFEGKLTNKNVNDGDLPNGWKLVSMEDVTSKITDGEHLTPKRIKAGEILLSAKNVRDGFIDYSDHDCISKKDFDKCLLRCNAEIGDILIVSVGATIGRTAIVKETIKFALVRSVALLKPMTILNKYLLYYIQSPQTQKRIQELSQGSAQNCLYINKIKQINVPLCSVQEQNKIIAELERKITYCDKFEETINQCLKQAETIRQSILKKAFEGKLIPN